MPILVIQHSNSSDTGLIGEALLRHGLRCRTIRLADGDKIPADLDGIDGILSMGGSASATDDSLPWIADEIALLAAASAAHIPVLGVCLGHSCSPGPSVEPSPGWSPRPSDRAGST